MCVCGKRVQVNAVGKLRPHAVPIPNRKDPKRAERCPSTQPMETTTT